MTATTELPAQGERWFRALVEHGTDAIVLFGADGTVRYAAPAVLQLCGFTPAHLTGSIGFKMVHPDDIAIVRGQMRAMHDAPGDAVTAEFRIRHADGSWRWVQAVGKDLLNDPGVGAIVVSFRDIDGRRRMEEELVASRDQLEAIFGSVADGLLVQDARGELVYANETAARLLGLPALDVLLHTAMCDVLADFAIADEAGVPFPLEQLSGRRVVRGELLPELTLQFRARSTGVVRWLAIRSTPVFDAHGQGTLVVSVLRDVTVARELERARDEFLASVSHDLKTPLTALQGFAQLVARRAGRIPQAEAVWFREPIEGIEKAAARMTALIYEFLDVARMQMHQPLTLSRRHIDLVALAAREIEARQRMTERHDIRLVARVPQLIGDWDAARLERAIGNLIGNAVKYSTAGGEISVTIERSDGLDGPQALLCVCDTGIGIPAADLPRVFDRFYRGANVLGAGIEGAGIGLFSARQIVAQHGGSIDVKSCAGEGTTVRICLPIDEADE